MIVEILVGLGIAAGLLYREGSVKKQKAKFAILDGKVVPKAEAICAMEAQLKNLDQQEALLQEQLRKLEEAAK